MSRRLTVLAVVSTAILVDVVAGCCKLAPPPRRDPDPSASEPAPPAGPANSSDEPRVTSSLVDLGTVTHPSAADRASAAMHSWSARPLRPAAHRMGYALDPTEGRAIQDMFHAYARSVRYQPGKGGRFVWVPPRGCPPDMQCVLESLAARSRTGVAPIAERFKKRVKSANLNPMDTASLIVTFVQNIHYEIPEKEPFGLLPPALVVSQKRGDCDSKALLGHMLLDSFGIRSILLSSEAHKHMMLGIALPASGKTFTHGGSRYAFTECTAKGSPIGHINPELLRPNAWRAVPIRLPAAGGNP